MQAHSDSWRPIKFSFNASVNEKIIKEFLFYPDDVEVVGNARAKSPIKKLEEPYLANEDYTGEILHKIEVKTP